MSIVCNSPKFEVSSESSSYFNLHIPGTYMTPASAADNNNNNNNDNNNNNTNNNNQHNNNHNHKHQSSSNSSSSSSSSSSSLSYSSSSSTSNNPSGYFDVKPLSSPAQTPYFDALTSPFIHNNFNNLNNDDINNHQQRPNQQISFSSWNNNNSCINNNGGGVFTSTLPLTPSLFPNTSAASSSSPYFPFSASQPPSSTPTPPPSSSSSISSSLPTSSCSSLSSSSSSSSTSSTSSASLPKRHLLSKYSDNNLSNKRPHSLPSSSSFAFVSPFQEFSPESVESLLQQLDQQQRKTILLLDIRPYSSFSNGRIKSSIHLCAPSTLIKRPAFTIDNLTTLVNDVDRQIFREWPVYENIIIYDNDTTALTENSPIFHICKKFIIPPPADKCPKIKIGFLKGGFPSFSSMFPGLCEKVDSNNNNNSGTFPRRRLLLDRKPGPFTCPTPVTESSNVNHFFNNIRQNIECVAITETIPIRLPTQNNMLLDQSKLPPFIRDVAFKDNGRMKLAELFLEIETTEQNRLKSLMVKNSNVATLDDPYSISAGIEKGTKNRYNNIWPYDHTRVKINECREGDCDYVNASFLQAKGCDKRYIATQGPLPTTYEDFWKIVWEQNSRLIVMLTKEEEAGRIQCHRYWSESPSNPCGYGPLNLTLISESSMQTTTTNNCNINENNNLKFPPIITDNTIVVRKFKLSHKNHPDIPPREITQLHFLGWPDFGTPETPINILKLIDMANNLQSEAVVEAQRQHEQIGPMVVHCSAGCGRTGTFCTIDTVISILSASPNDHNDIKDIIQNTVLNFREQRLSIVQNLRQFVFCYEAILWKLVGAI